MLTEVWPPQCMPRLCHVFCYAEIHRTRWPLEDWPCQQTVEKEYYQNQSFINQTEKFLH